MPSPVVGEQTPNTIRYRIEEELRDFEHPSGYALYVIGKAVFHRHRHLLAAALERHVLRIFQRTRSEDYPQKFPKLFSQSVGGSSKNGDSPACRQHFEGLSLQESTEIIQLIKHPPTLFNLSHSS